VHPNSVGRPGEAAEEVIKPCTASFGKGSRCFAALTLNTQQGLMEKQSVTTTTLKEALQKENVRHFALRSSEKGQMIKTASLKNWGNVL
jgi:hypothetical protein